MLQHTIEGKMAYAPVVGRLECGVFPSDPRGFWQENGYGILSVFKVDWDRFGGLYYLLELTVQNFIYRYPCKAVLVKQHTCSNY